MVPCQQSFQSTKIGAGQNHCEAHCHICSTSLGFCDRKSSQEIPSSAKQHEDPEMETIEKLSGTRRLNSTNPWRSIKTG